MHPFSFIGRVGAILFFFALATAGFSTQAQQPTAPNPFGNRYDKIGDGVYYPPAVYVDKLKYDSTSGNGSFNILNESGDAMGDLGYRIEVRGKLPKLQKGETLVADNAPIYWTEIKNETYALADKEEKNVNFQFTPPSLPEGEYRLRVRIFTSQGQDLGRDDVAFTATEPTESFVLLTSGKLSTPEYGTETFHPQEGPNIKPSEKIVLNYTAENLGNKALSAIPTLAIFNAKEKIATQTGQPITLPRGATSTYKLELSAPASPNAYRAELTLQESSTQKIVSSPAEFRFVTRGVSGRILTLRADSLRLTDKNELLVNASVVGPADSETTVDGKIEFSVLDEKGQVGAYVAPETLKLTDGVISGKSLVQLTRNIEGTATLKAILKTTAGQTLDEYQVELDGLKFLSLSTSIKNTPDIDSKEKSSLSYPFLIGIILLILVILVALFFGYRKYRKPFNPLLLLIVLFSSLATSVFAVGNGIIVHRPLDKGGNIADTVDIGWPQLGSRPILTLNIIKPWHNQPANTYAKNSVPLDYEFSFAACSNAVTKIAFDFHYLKEGGKISTLKPGAGQTYEKIAYTDTYSLNGCPRETFCMNESSFLGTLNLNNLIQDADSTTLRAIMRVGRLVNDGNKCKYAPKEWKETQSDYTEWTQPIYAWACHGVMYATNIWLNFAPPLTCNITGPSPFPSPVPFGTQLTLTAVGGDPNQPYRWSSSNASDVFSSTTGATTTVTPQAGSPTISVANGDLSETCGPNITVTQPQPQIQVTVDGVQRNSTTPIDFGNQEKNTSVTKTVTITNVGDPGSVLQINSGDISILPVVGAFTFPTVPSIPDLAQGQSETFSISFNPTEARDYSTNLNVTSNDSNGTLIIGLVGAGIQAPDVTLQFKKDGTYVNSLTVAKNTPVTLHTAVTPADSICTASSFPTNSNWTGTKTTAAQDTPVGTISATTSFSLECKNPLNTELSTKETITVTVQSSGSGTNIRDL